MNPFTHKFTAFSANLSEKNAAHTKQTISTKSGEVFADKPFTIEYKGIYTVTKVGQSVAQVVTFLTTAALGVFALTHIVPLWWGIYIAIPLGLLFAFGVEKIKRSTLAIAAKHFLKYGQFGTVGFVALLVMCISIAAALYGAKELPGVMYAKPERKNDPQAAQELQKQADVVQSDINRLQSKLDNKKDNWTAENRTLPRLQKQRAELISKMTDATQRADQATEQQYNEAQAERAANVEKMQIYSVGAAIVAELIFLFCTGFILYYLFRHYAEQNEAQATNETNTDHIPNRRNAGTFVANLRADDNRTLTKIVTTTTNDATKRTCDHCGTAYTYRHAKQRFCSDQCRISSWQRTTGKTLKRTGNATNAT
jgi:Skp family chaperone for outer membrane proteins